MLWVKQHGDFQQHCGSFCSLYNLVSLKDKWNEGFPKFGVVLKDLEVEPKRDKKQIIKNIIKQWSTAEVCCI